MTEHNIAFWNVENLFDVENSPRRTDKLQRALRGELAGWTSDVLERKIQQLAAIIKQMNGGAGPDLLGVCEIENEYVLDLLVGALSALGRDYGIAHADTQDERGIDVAFIYDKSRFGFLPGEKWHHAIVKRTATRDLLQVNFRTPRGKLLVVIGNHWPSRLGGQYESEPYRIIAGETLAYFHERIREIQGKDVGIIAMGDFNDEPFNRSLTDYAQSEQTRTKVTKATSAKFLNLMWPTLGKGIGSHYHENAPNLLDQFLVSKGLLTGKSSFEVIPESEEVVRYPEMVKKGDYPVPIRFGRPAEKKGYNPDGFSDHFPISMKVKEK